MAEASVGWYMHYTKLYYLYIAQVCEERPGQILISRIVICGYYQYYNKQIKYIGVEY